MIFEPEIFGPEVSKLIGPKISGSTPSHSGNLAGLHPHPLAANAQSMITGSNPGPRAVHAFTFVEITKNDHKAAALDATPTTDV